jgi:hypothetical protein
VPLELAVPGPTQFESVLRVPGQPPEYTRQLPRQGYLRLSAHPERAGPTTVYVTAFNLFESEAGIDQLTLTTAGGRGATRPRSVRRVGRGRFAARVELARGANTVTVIARPRDGSRMRSTFDLAVPSG